MKYDIYNSCCFEGMKKLETESVHSIVTDPPYGLSKQPNMTEVLQHWLSDKEYKNGTGFMGKTWDSFVPSPLIWKEAYRVLKHGAWAVVFAGSRTQDLMALSLRLAGFEIMDTGMWLYGSGFPKSLDISKAIDKSLGAERSKIRIDASEVRNPKTHGSGTDGTVGATRPWMEKALEVGYHEKDSNEPATDQAKQWQGWGTALKPAYEPFILARKPLDGTYANNVLKHGVGGLNIDACRIGDDVRINQPAGNKQGGNSYNMSVTGMPTNAKPTEVVGRFPANVIHDGLDETWAKYFYCAKASKKDRGDNNIHPTVKPTDLMRYLCRLVTPKGGIILDPFMGSGSTGKACVFEDFDFIGFDITPEYFQIAENRIEEAKKDVESKKENALDI